jgi:hypothetical protein
LLRVVDKVVMVQQLVAAAQAVLCIVHHLLFQLVHIRLLLVQHQVQLLTMELQEIHQVFQA